MSDNISQLKQPLKLVPNPSMTVKILTAIVTVYLVILFLALLAIPVLGALWLFKNM